MNLLALTACCEPEVPRNLDIFVLLNDKLIMNKLVVEGDGK
jgi:hypothetical protein